MVAKLKKSIGNISIVTGMIVLVMFLWNSCAPAEKSKATTVESAVPSIIPNNSLNSCPITTSEFDGWFESGSVTKDGVVDAADSKNFPSNNTNCDFYKWSEQMFLWITSPYPGYAGVFDSPVFYDVSPEDANGNRVLISHQKNVQRNFSPRVIQNGPQRLPVLIHPKTGKLMEIDTPKKSSNGLNLVSNNVGENVEALTLKLVDNKLVYYNANGDVIKAAKPVFTKGLNTDDLVQIVRVGGKSIYVDKNGEYVDEAEQGQAGGGDVLMTQDGSLVYYTILVNDVYAVFRSMYPDAKKFPDTEDELDAIVKQAAKMGIIIDDKDALALELKMSWVLADSVPNDSDYVTTSAIIPTYTPNANNTKWIKTGTTTAKLVLVGVHVVGNVAGHPEMLWSTFEHVNNTPLNTYSYLDENSKEVTVNSSTSGTWNFCANGSTGPFNQAHMAMDTVIGDTIIANSGFTVTPSNTLRNQPWGAAAGTIPNQNVSSAAESNSEIISINNNVMTMLITGDVRGNYMQIGNTWTMNGAFPTGEYADGGNEIGTSNLANSTMETYHQDLNCFVCHSNFPTDSNDAYGYVGLSHIFGAIVPMDTAR
jgi:hypothetical protein